MATAGHNTPTVHKAKKKVDDVRSEINVTPLVDVCLVLLIIFMVVADKLARGMEVPLPKTKYHNTRKDTGEDLVISLVRDGGRAMIYWDRDQIRDADDLKKRMTEELRRRGRPVFVKADADLIYKDVYPLLIAIHESGAPVVQLGTTELKE